MPVYLYRYTDLLSRHVKKTNAVCVNKLIFFVNLLLMQTSINRARTNYNTVRLEQIDNYLNLENFNHQLKKEFLSRMLRWLQSRKRIRHRLYVVVIESIAPPSQVIGLFQNHLKVNVIASDEI